MGQGEGTTALAAPARRLRPPPANMHHKRQIKYDITTKPRRDTTRSLTFFGAGGGDHCIGCSGTTFTSCSYKHASHTQNQIRHINLIGTPQGFSPFLGGEGVTVWDPPSRRLRPVPTNIHHKRQIKYDKPTSLGHHKESHLFFGGGRGPLHEKKSFYLKGVAACSERGPLHEKKSFYLKGVAACSMDNSHMTWGCRNLLPQLQITDQQINI